MRRSLPALVTLIAASFLPLANADKDKDGKDGLQLTLRSRKPIETPDKKTDYKTEEISRVWMPKQSAIIVCDMWDTHHCYNAAMRVEEIAPRMNEVLEKARALGVLIIHAPSSCMDAYKDHPARKAAMKAPPAKNLPKDISAWCHIIPAEEKGKYPIDQKDGGCDSDPADEAKHRQALVKMGRNPNAPWKSQIAALKIHDDDIISDSGVEIWNVLEDRKIDNVIILGVHTNMCVLGRPFGIRQQVRLGMNTVLVRDLTDAMYDPRQPPYVSHARGTELVVEHIEKYWCPSILSDDLASVVAGTAGP